MFKFFLLLSLSLPVIAVSLEGRFIENSEKCSILINENRLSGRELLSVECKLFLVDQYKYKFVIDDKVCPYKVKKVGLVVPGVDAKPFHASRLSKKCSTKK